MDSSEPTSPKLYCPIEQTFTITEEKLKEIHQINNYNKINGEVKQVIGIPHVTYHLAIKYGSANSGKKAFFFYLFVTTSKATSRIHAKYSFIIKSESYITQFNNVFLKESYGWGDEICNVDEFFDSRRKFIENGEFKFEMKGIRIFDDEEMPKLVQPLPSLLVQQLWQRDDKEFKIVVKDEGNVMIHGFVLSSRSDFFEGMFRSGMEEATTNTLKVIDFSLKTVQTAVEYFYDLNIFDNLELADAFELLRFADKYNIYDLQIFLEMHLTYQLSPSTVCELTNGSINANSIKMMKVCGDFLTTCQRHYIPVDNLEILNEDFAAELFRKPLSLCAFD